MTGHGCINICLRKIGNLKLVICRYCHREDTAGHTIFECDRWYGSRSNVETAFGHEITQENLVRLMLQRKSSRGQIAEMMQDIIKTKENDERSEESPKELPCYSGLKGRESFRELKSHIVFTPWGLSNAEGKETDVHDAFSAAHNKKGYFTKRELWEFNIEKLFILRHSFPNYFGQKYCEQKLCAL